MQAKVTIADIRPNVRRGVAARILHHLEASPTTTVKDATKTAAFENLREARIAGWSQRALEALVETYAIVGAQIVADALRQN